MKISRGLFIFGFLVIAFWYWSRPSSEVSTSKGTDISVALPKKKIKRIEPVSSLSKVVAIPNTLQVTGGALPMDPSTSQRDSATPIPPPPLHVPFEVDEDGMAIAFSDVMLGMPTTEVSSGKGNTKPPDVKLWDPAVIPFHIQPQFPHPERIREALEVFNGTPISFVPYTGQKDAIVFESKPNNCRSYLGKVGGLQPIWLSENCYAPQIIHEIMHALGFVHEQSRIDRDIHLEILWDNIEDDFKDQFAMVPAGLMKPMRDTPFDFHSIMLYKPEAFAKRSGMLTMKPRNSEVISPAQSLSKQDIDRLFKVYGR